MQTTIATFKRILALSFLAAATLVLTSPLMAQETITPIMTHALAAAPGSEALMYTVDFPPVFQRVHRHARRCLFMYWRGLSCAGKGGKRHARSDL